MRNLALVLALVTFLALLGILAIFGFYLGRPGVAFFVCGVLSGFMFHIGQELARQAGSGERWFK
jgi:hypothetical protein